MNVESGERRPEFVASDHVLDKLYLIYEISGLLTQPVEQQIKNYIVLTAITMGEGLGFNRAVLYSISNDQAFLEGTMGVGPSTASEAQQIWSQISFSGLPIRKKFKELIDAFVRPSDLIHARVIQHRINLLDDRGVFARSVSGKRLLVVPDDVPLSELTPADRQILQSDHFAVVPLQTHRTLLGVIAVDNLFSGRQISPDDLQFLRMIAQLMASSMDQHNAYEKLYRLTHELKNIRESLIQSEKITAIGEMMLFLAHEIRNPLAVIGGFARKLSADLPPDTNLATYATIIRDETVRLEQFLKKLFDSLQADTVQPYPCDLNGEIKAIVNFLSLYFDENDIDVSLVLENDLPSVMADETPLRHILYNLLNNAVQAQPEGGFIRIETNSNRSMVNMLIADNGPGVPEEKIKDIFKPFFTTKPSGTGLGLPYVKKLMKRFGGSITASTGSTGGLEIRLSFSTATSEGGIS